MVLLFCIIAGLLISIFLFAVTGKIDKDDIFWIFVIGFLVGFLIYGMRGIIPV